MSPWLQAPPRRRPRLRTTLLGERRLVRGQSVDAWLCTLAFIYGAVSDRPIVSLGMVKGVPSQLAGQTDVSDPAAECGSHRHDPTG